MGGVLRYSGLTHYQNSDSGLSLRNSLQTFSSDASLLKLNAFTVTFKVF